MYTLRQLISAIVLGLGFAEMDWRELAAMMTVLAICGSCFTWIMSRLIDRIIGDKFSKFEDRLRDSFVSKDTMLLMKQEADMDHARYEKTFSDMWDVIRDLQRSGRLR